MPKYLFGVSLMLLCTPVLFAQKILYVDQNNGKNSYPGTLDQPVQTIHRAIDLANSSDTIEIHGGYYLYEDRIRIDKNDLTLRSFPGEWAIIETPTKMNGDATATIFFSEGVRGGMLDRLEIIGGEYYGVMVSTVYDNRQPQANDIPTGGITIKNCRIHDTGRDCVKLSAGTFDIRIENCEIYRSGIAC